MEYTDKWTSQQRFKKYSSFFITARDKFVHQCQYPRSITVSNDKHAKQLKFTLVISNSRDTLKNKQKSIYLFPNSAKKSVECARKFTGWNVSASHQRRCWLSDTSFAYSSKHLVLKEASSKHTYSSPIHLLVLIIECDNNISIGTSHIVQLSRNIL